MDRQPSQPRDTSPDGTSPADVLCAACPSRRVLGLVADKWTLLIMPALAQGPQRNSQLLRRVEGISQKMLTQTLKELERNGLVRRRDYGEVPPRVDYELTALGLSLAMAIRQLDTWAEQHYAAVLTARETFDIERGGR